MNLRHIWLIVKREYLERLRSPGFIMGTLLGVVGIAALSFLPQALKLLDQQTSARIAVVDPRGLVYPYISRQTDLATPQPGEPPDVQSTQVPGTRIIFQRAATDDQQALSEQVSEGKISAYMVVLGETAASVQLEIHSKDRLNTTSNAVMRAQLTSAVALSRLREAGITPAQAATLFAPPSIAVQPLVGGQLKDETQQAQSEVLVYVLLILLYGTMVMYGVQVATGVVYEKSSRVMEVLITAVRPIELMLGKVVGVGMLGLTQYALWVAIGFGALILSGALGKGGAGTGIELASVPPVVLVSFLLFFLLGYLVYAAVYAGLGSLVNRTEDVNSITTPLTLLLVGAYLLSLLALGQPDATWVVVLSFVPFLTPMLMFIRVALGNPAWWEPALSMVIMFATILLLSWIAARIYRVGVLLYGKRPSFREIGRLLRTA